MKMYNEKQKLRYLKDCEGVYDESTIRNIVSKFNVCEWIEIERGKDISLFTKYEIDDYLYTVGMKSSPGSLASIVSYYSKYVEWCINNSLVPSGINHFDEIVGEKKFDKYLNRRLTKRKYITPGELDDVLKRIHNPRDQFVLCCLYEFGISPNQVEIMNIHFSDFDLKNNTVKLISGREPKVSQKLIHYAELADQELEYTVEVYDGSFRKYKLLDNGLVYKDVDWGPIKPSPNASQRIFKLLRQVKKSTGLDDAVTANSLSDAGFFMFVESEAEKIGIDPIDFIKENEELLINQYNKNTVRALVIYKKVKDLF